ncbi:Methyltransferase domain-containing protein [Nonlabens sp. Hel1_33_55]|nr:Methyltransferase domain-containing protein [Nonlabens sp. Hel1_33_55]
MIHRWKSVHLHGIHSPFVFEFSRDCLKDDRYFEEYEKFSRFRESVKNNPQQLQIIDHGAGSRVFKSNSRSTSNILKHNCSSLKQMKLLYRIGDYFKTKQVLELGTSLGTGTISLSLAANQVRTVEGSAEVASYARERFREFKLENVQVSQQTFDQFFKELSNTRSEERYDLIYIDGHHDGTATLDYFEKILPHCHEDTVVILDDIYWSQGMTKAWKKLQKHSKVTVSIDTYDWGIIFFRPQQRQQAFHIKL